MKIILAMSGGIDSGVAAWLLKEQGHQVHALFMKHSFQREDESDAAKIARHLGIPLDVLDVSESFENVVDRFTDEYFSGRTPNPCVFCNRTVKFGVLYDHAFSRLDAEGFATGHYVRKKESDGHPALFKAGDELKDQSYVLYGIDRNRLAKLHFPLGNLAKTEIRQIAAEIGLHVTKKKESQDICFVESGKHPEFLHARRPGTDTSGRFVSPDGKLLALHAGFEQFTVGQRKGMGVGFGKRIFVLKLDAATKNVVIGDWDDLACRRLKTADARWLLPGDPEKPFSCDVKVRYRCRPSKATVVPLQDGGLDIELDEPCHGVAPGQSAVFYDGDRLLGGSIIEEGFKD